MAARPRATIVALQPPPPSGPQHGRPRIVRQRADGAMQLEPIAGKRKICSMGTAEEDHGQRLKWARTNHYDSIMEMAAPDAEAVADAASSAVPVQQQRRRRCNTMQMDVENDPILPGIPMHPAKRAAKRPLQELDTAEYASEASNVLEAPAQPDSKKAKVTHALHQDILRNHIPVSPRPQQASAPGQFTPASISKPQYANGEHCATVEADLLANPQPSNSTRPSLERMKSTAKTPQRQAAESSAARHKTHPPATQPAEGDKLNFKLQNRSMGANILLSVLIASMRTQRAASHVPESCSSATCLAPEIAASSADDINASSAGDGITPVRQQITIITESTVAQDGAAVPEASPSPMPIFECKVNPLFDLEETCANSLFDLEGTCGNPLFDLEEACANALFDLEETCSNPLFEDYTDSPNTDNNQGSVAEPADLAVAPHMCPFEVDAEPREATTKESASGNAAPQQQKTSSAPACAIDAAEQGHVNQPSFEAEIPQVCKHSTVAASNAVTTRAPSTCPAPSADINAELARPPGYPPSPVRPSTAQPKAEGSLGGRQKHKRKEKRGESPAPPCKLSWVTYCGVEIPDGQWKRFRKEDSPAPVRKGQEPTQMGPAAWTSKDATDLLYFKTVYSVRRKSVADTKAAQKERLKKQTGSSDWTKPSLSAMRYCSHQDDPIIDSKVKSAAEVRDMILESNGGVAPQPGHDDYRIYQMSVKAAQGVRIIGGRAIQG